MKFDAVFDMGIVESGLKQTEDLTLLLQITQRAAHKYRCSIQKCSVINPN